MASSFEVVLGLENGGIRGYRRGMNDSFEREMEEIIGEAKALPIKPASAPVMVREGEIVFGKGLPTEGTKEKGLPDGSKPLRNLNHERFAALVVEGKPDSVAYMESYQCSKQSAEDNAWKLRRDEGIERRVVYLQKQVTSAKILTLIERREKLATIVRHKVDVEDITIGDQLAAIKLDAEMAGELTPGGLEKTPMRLRLIASTSGDATSLAAEIDGI
jgi:hypothetical protein